MNSSDTMTIDTTTLMAEIITARNMAFAQAQHIARQNNTHYHMDSDVTFVEDSISDPHHRHEFSVSVETWQTLDRAISRVPGSRTLEIPVEVVMGWRELGVYI